MIATDLFKPNAPFLQLHTASDVELFGELHELERGAEPSLLARAVRGRKCATREAFFNEVGAAWQLPYHFGENWDALVDCLSDLRWRPADAYVFIVQRAASFLNHEPPETLKTFVSAMSQIAERWAKPSKNQRKAIFRVVLHSTKEELAQLEARLRSYGAALGQRK